MELVFTKIYELLNVEFMFSAFAFSYFFNKFIAKIDLSKVKGLKGKLLRFGVRHKQTGVFFISFFTGLVFYWLFAKENGFDYEYVSKLITSFAFTIVLYDFVIKQFLKFLKNESIKKSPDSNSESSDSISTVV
ncbi:MAG: hypothetical protein HC836_41250 [Richelia sp. RM2_1_2]|nr:hypothetical protein [Richelia sp. RM2_1_2]